MKRLGVNIDHVATLRQQRQEGSPNLVQAAQTVLKAGADSITIHLREDRRHIQDQDVFDIKALGCYLNLEMAATDEMLAIAKAVKPQACCLVPEKREELTTEGGLDVKKNILVISRLVKSLKACGIRVSLFVDPSKDHIQAASDAGADCIELHTGSYCLLRGVEQDKSLYHIIKMADFAHTLGLEVHAGHGLDTRTIADIAKIPYISELNIGFSIISRALFIGLEAAVVEIKSYL
jgi:pyridoxine 5-phosphate synthase